MQELAAQTARGDAPDILALQEQTSISLSLSLSLSYIYIYIYTYIYIYIHTYTYNQNIYNKQIGTDTSSTTTVKHVNQRSKPNRT